jgi:glycine/D-amino acid oxidase-like deaminating enzyme/nitrite reductase/ring-hydroxylating ferredoxin subunit
MNTTSHWIDSMTLPRFPKVGGDVSVDVIVVGGGITGITTAYLLKRAGLTVALLERERLARIDTGHTTAHLTQVIDTRLHTLIKFFGFPAARAVWDSGGAAIDKIVEIIHDEKIRCDFSRLPGYLHAPTSSSRTANEELRHEFEAAQDLGIEARFHSEIPGFAVPGVEFPNQAIFHPLKFLGALLRLIEGDGSHVFEDTAAESFESAPLVVKTGAHRIRGGYLMLATHNPLIGNASLVTSLLLQTRLSLYTSYALGAVVPKGSLPLASFWDTGDPYYYLRVERRADQDYAVFGGEDHKTGQTNDTVAVYRSLEEKFLSLVPGARIDHRWSGQVIETNDGLPFIGENAENQFVATGFAGNGMTFGVLGAMMAVDAVMHRENRWKEVFDVHRTKFLGGTWTYLSENKDYPYCMIHDRLARTEEMSPDDLGLGEGRILHIDGRKVAAYRDLNGEVSLCSPVCTHLQCIVAWNEAEHTWDCPCHGSRFKPTGEVISGPAEESLERLPATTRHVPEPDHAARL